MKMRVCQDVRGMVAFFCRRSGVFIQRGNGSSVEVLVRV